MKPYSCRKHPAKKTPSLRSSSGLLMTARRKAFAEQLTVRCFAHRGLHTDPHTCPENSLAAFRSACEQGLGIELDLQLTADRQIVVFHDASLARVCGQEGLVSDYTLAELQELTLYDSAERIPLFAEVLELVGGRVPLLIEFKLPDASSPLCALAAPLLDRYQGCYMMESFHPAALYWFRKHRPEVPRGQLGTDFRRAQPPLPFRQLLPMQLQLTNLITRPDFLSFDSRYCNQGPFRFWHRHIPAFAWTVRSAAEMRELKSVFRCFICEREYSS